MNFKTILKTLKTNKKTKLQTKQRNCTALNKTINPLFNVTPHQKWMKGTI